MTDEEIKAFCSLLLTAGGETTDKAITSLMANLVAHPAQLEAVRDDRALIPAAFAETLRFSPPVHMIMRQPAEDVELSGGIVEAGRTVTCLIGAANRDERRFDRPEVFDVLRDDLDHARAFSAARRPPGLLPRSPLLRRRAARRCFEIEIGVNDLLDAMTDIRFADGAPPPETGVFTRAPGRAAPRVHPGPMTRRTDHDRTRDVREHPRQGVLGLRRGRPRPHRELLHRRRPDERCRSAGTATLVGPFEGRAAIRALHADSMAAQTDQRRHNLSNTLVREGDRRRGDGDHAT